MATLHDPVETTSLRDRESDSSSSESGSSYIGSDDSTTHSGTCRWRTHRFHNQECLRYFDCPSHQIERELSDDDDDGDEEDGEDENDDNDTGDNEEVASPTEQQHIGTTSATPHSSHHVVDRNIEPGSNTSSSFHQGTTDEPRHSPSSGSSLQIHSLPPQTSPVSLSQPQLATTNQQGPAPLHSDNSGYSTQEPRATTVTSRPQRVVRPSMGFVLSTFSGQSLVPAEQARPSISPRQVESTSPERYASPLAIARRPSDIALPRWQSDAEVTYCPICHTQFSIFVRKHHCRKCGRVVCNSCSPHRITIPYAYIVRPPGQSNPPLQQIPSAQDIDGGYTDLASPGGGERVRLCNPCVPDPNIAPPHNQTSPGPYSPRAHQRSQSSLAGLYPAFRTPSRSSSTTAGGNDIYARTRSVTLQPGRSNSTNSAPSQNRIMIGTPPAPSSSRHRTSLSSRYRLVGEGSSSSSSSGYASQRALPPTPQIAEEDECPICHRELPPRSMANFESLRESHISSCIVAHSAQGRRTATATSSTPEAAGGRGEEEVGSSGSGTTHVRRMRQTGMFPYVATEKDCVDSAECTICLEEFEAGVAMARLECLCRYHRACIEAWFVKHPGRCPVHQHDGFGF